MTLGVVFSVKSQDLLLNLKAGDFILQKNIDSNFSEQDPYRMLFFEQLPNDREKRELNDIGIDFLYYLPKNIFVVFCEKKGVFLEGVALTWSFWDMMDMSMFRLLVQFRMFPVPN